MPERRPAAAPDEPTGYVIDRGRMAIVLLHELFDGKHAGPVFVTEDLGQPRLFVPDECVLGAAGAEMQFVAYAQQKLTSLAQRGRVVDRDVSVLLQAVDTCI